jgi:hypothetical protein
MVPHPHFNGARHAPPLYSRGFEPWPQPDAANSAAAGGFPPAAPALQPALSALGSYAAHGGMSLAPHMQTQTQTQYHSESGEADEWRRDHLRHRRRLDDEERSLVAEGRERVVRTLRELESGGTSCPGRGAQGKRRGEETDLASTLRYKLQRLDTLSGRYIPAIHHNTQHTHAPPHTHTKTQSCGTLCRGAPIWTDDAHLSYFSATSECIRLYVVHSWPSCPLSPLALSEVGTCALPLQWQLDTHTTSP